MSRARLTPAQARRTALAAQGFGRPRPTRVTGRHVRRVIDAVAQFQIDSVNVAVRAQYMPLFSRLGPYDTGLLDAAAGRAPRALVEYWGHAASLVDVRLHPALRWRMRQLGVREAPRIDRLRAAAPDLVQRVLAEVRDAGPLAPRDIDGHQQRERVQWGWNWSDAKHVLEYLFDCGTLAVARRNAAFERLYDLTERVVPPSILAQPEPDPHEAHVALVRRSARALGVADVSSLATYFYLKRAPVLAAIAELEASGELEPVEVAGLPQPFWRWHGARTPRALDTRALVSPFDSLVFDRARLERLFDTEYRIEIYTPAAQRRHGYYVYLFVLGDRFAARVDLKAERARGVLVVRSAWLEPGADAHATAAALASEVQDMASWLGLGAVEVGGAGTLAGHLARAL